MAQTGREPHARRAFRPRPAGGTQQGPHLRAVLTRQQRAGGDDSSQSPAPWRQRLGTTDQLREFRRSLGEIDGARTARQQHPRQRVPEAMGHAAVSRTAQANRDGGKLRHVAATPRSHSPPAADLGICLRRGIRHIWRFSALPEVQLREPAEHRTWRRKPAQPSFGRETGYPSPGPDELLLPDEHIREQSARIRIGRPLGAIAKQIADTAARLVRPVGAKECFEKTQFGESC